MGGNKGKQTLADSVYFRFKDGYIIYVYLKTYYSMFVKQIWLGSKSLIAEIFKGEVHQNSEEKSIFWSWNRCSVTSTQLYFGHSICDWYLACHSNFFFA